MSVLTTWELVSPQESDLGENKEEATYLYDLALKVTLCRFCNILLVAPLGPVQVGGDLERENQEVRFMRTTSEPGYHTRSDHLHFTDGRN